MMADLMTVHAREKGRLPQEWDSYRWACLPPGGPEYFYLEVTGAIAPLKPNGRKNWRKMDKATRATVRFSVAEHDAWLLEWEKRTGKCSECTGDGKTLASANSKGEVTYRQCFKCKGTGTK